MSANVARALLAETKGYARTVAWHLHGLWPAERKRREQKAAEMQAQVDAMMKAFERAVRGEPCDCEGCTTEKAVDQFMDDNGFRRTVESDMDEATETKLTTLVREFEDKVKEVLGERVHINVEIGVLE